MLFKTKTYFPTKIRSQFLIPKCYNLIKQSLKNKNYVFFNETLTLWNLFYET